MHPHEFIFSGTTIVSLHIIPILYSLTLAFDATFCISCQRAVRNKNAEYLHSSINYQHLMFNCINRHKSTLNWKFILILTNGPGGSVGIATDYGLDGPGSNCGGDENFCPSRPALGATQPPVPWIPSLSRG